MIGQSGSLPFLQRALEHLKYSGTSNPNSRYGGRSWIGLFVDDTRTRMSATSGKASKTKFIFEDVFSLLHTAENDQGISLFAASSSPAWKHPNTQKCGLHRQA